MDIHTDDLGLDLGIAERLTDDLRVDEIEEHADIHRRAVAKYEARKADARKARKARIATLEAERRTAKATYEAEIERIRAAMNEAAREAAGTIARAEQLAATSRAALAVLEREG